MQTCLLNDSKFHVCFQEQKSKQIEKLGQKAQLRRQFSNFKEGIAEQNVESANEEAADDFCNAKILWRGLRALRLATKRSQHIRQAFQNKAQVLFSHFVSVYRIETPLVLDSGAPVICLSRKYSRSNTDASNHGAEVRKKE